MTYQFSWEGQLFETIADVFLDLEPQIFNDEAVSPSSWVRDSITDLNQDQACNSGEICAFLSRKTGLTWASFYKPSRITPAQWVQFCEGLGEGSHRQWRLPELSEVTQEREKGIWPSQRQHLFQNEWWWGTHTLTKAPGGDQLYFWINVDSGNFYPQHRSFIQSDRSLCVSER